MQFTGGVDRLQHRERIERIDRLLGVPMHPSLQVTPSEVIFAARSEMALGMPTIALGERSMAFGL